MNQGTKCFDEGPGLVFQLETLGSIYREIAEEYGHEQIKKPKPGDSYRKMYRPISDMDRPAFRHLPADIIITQPPRLFRSTAWKYNGEFYKQADTFWQFEAKYPWKDGFIFDWYPVRILSYAYIYNTVTFYRQPQLSLF